MKRKSGNQWMAIQINDEETQHRIGAFSANCTAESISPIHKTIINKSSFGMGKE